MQLHEAIKHERSKAENTTTEIAQHRLQVARWLEELQGLRMYESGSRSRSQPYILDANADEALLVLKYDPAKGRWLRTELYLLKRGDSFRCVDPAQPIEEWEAPSTAAGNPQLNETWEKGVYVWCITVEPPTEEQK